MTDFVFKILRAAELSDFQRIGMFRGSADDARDGFIHLSTAEQVPCTLGRHFGGDNDAAETGLSLLSFTVADFGELLKWEPSRNGELFPHVYGPLLMSNVLQTASVDVDSDGRHVLPDGIG